MSEARFREDCPQPQPDELPAPVHPSDVVVPTEDDGDDAGDPEPRPGAGELAIRIAALLDPVISDLGSELEALADDPSEAEPMERRVVAKALETLALRARDLASRIHVESRIDNTRREDRHRDVNRPGRDRRRPGPR